MKKIIIKSLVIAVFFAGMFFSCILPEYGITAYVSNVTYNDVAGNANVEYYIENSGFDSLYNVWVTLRVSLTSDDDIDHTIYIGDLGVDEYVYASESFNYSSYAGDYESAQFVEIRWDGNQDL